MIDIPIASKPSTSKVRLAQRISTPPVYPDPDLELFDNYEESGFDWAGEPMVQRDISHWSITAKRLYPLSGSVSAEERDGG